MATPTGPPPGPSRRVDYLPPRAASARDGRRDVPTTAVERDACTTVARIDGRACVASGHVIAGSASAAGPWQAGTSNGLSTAARSSSSGPLQWETAAAGASAVLRRMSSCSSAYSGLGRVHGCEQLDGKAVRVRRGRGADSCIRTRMRMCVLCVRLRVLCARCASQVWLEYSKHRICLPPHGYRSIQYLWVARISSSTVRRPGCPMCGS